MVGGPTSMTWSTDNRQPVRSFPSMASHVEAAAYLFVAESVFVPLILYINASLKLWKDLGERSWGCGIQGARFFWPLILELHPSSLVYLLVSLQRRP